jgi:hypothetical protein
MASVGPTRPSAEHGEATEQPHAVAAQALFPTGISYPLSISGALSLGLRVFVV